MLSDIGYDDRFVKLFIDLSENIQKVPSVDGSS